MPDKDDPWKIGTAADLIDLPVPKGHRFADERMEEGRLKLGPPNPNEVPASNARFNENYSIVNIRTLLEKGPAREPSIRTELLLGFDPDAPFVFAEKVPIGSILDDFVQEGATEILLATFYEIPMDGTGIDYVAAFARKNGLPLVVLAFASRIKWEFGIPPDALESGQIAVASPSKALARILGVKLWETGDDPHLGNGLFLLTFLEGRSEHYRFAASWVAPFARMPHDITVISKGLQTLESAKKHST